MDFIQIVGLVAGIITSSAMLPQVIKIFKEKKAKDISLIMIIVLLIGLSLWVTYGFLRDDIPIIATNLFSVLVNMVLLGLSIKYTNKK